MEHQWLYVNKKWGFDCLAYATKFILGPDLPEHVFGITSGTLLIIEMCISRHKHQLRSCLMSSVLTKILYAAEFLLPVFKTF